MNVIPLPLHETVGLFPLKKEESRLWRNPMMGICGGLQDQVRAFQRPACLTWMREIGRDPLGPLSHPNLRPLRGHEKLP